MIALRRVHDSRAVATAYQLFRRGYSSAPPFSVTERCAKKLREVLKKDSNKQKFLRLQVKSGGCSGFQYDFSLDSNLSSDDCVYDVESDAKLVVDNSSLVFLNGATIDHVSELMKESFTVSNNPNAENSCGCGISFDAKLF